MVRCGIAGWIDRSLIDSRLFYPLHVTSSEERLQFYASQFPLVEVDSTYYGMPSRKNSELWVGRTPAGFLFDVKSFSLFTHHPTRANALPPELREGLSQKQRERNLYLDQLPPDLVDEAWDWFRDALQPLKESGRLGAVFFQFPPWFLPSSRSLTYLEEVQERMAGFAIAVEFRRREWLDERRRADTLGFLRARALPLVAVDVPAGFPTSLPPLSDVTSDQLAVVRFHCRNR